MRIPNCINSQQSKPTLGTQIKLPGTTFKSGSIASSFSSVVRSLGLLASDWPDVDSSAKGSSLLEPSGLSWSGGSWDVCFTPLGRSASDVDSSSTDALIMPLSGDSFAASSAENLVLFHEQINSKKYFSKRNGILTSKHWMSQYRPVVRLHQAETRQVVRGCKSLEDCCPIIRTNFMASIGAIFQPQLQSY